MVTYKILNQQHDEYDADKITRMRRLYAGGYEMRKHAEDFLPKMVIESFTSHSERVKCTAYIPYLSQFTDFFASSLFDADLDVVEPGDADKSGTTGESSANPGFYKLFASDCDLNGNSLHNFMLDTFSESLYTPYSLLGVDMPSLGDDVPKPDNLAEEEALGTDRAYLYDIDPVSLIDWKNSASNNKFQWVKLRSEVLIQDDPLSPPMKQVEFKIWTMNPQTETAEWRLFQTKPMKRTDNPKPNDEIPLTGEGRTSFREIPVFELRLPPGLLLGEKVGPVCEEYFQRRSFLINNQNKTCVAIITALLGAEIPEVDGPINSTQGNEERGNPISLRQSLERNGIVVLGSGDDLKIVEAEGKSHGLINTELKELAETMTAIVHQMANSVAHNSSAAGRSAKSKLQDRHATEILLGAYGRVVKDFVREVYKCISTARGDDIAWSVNGVSTFVEQDRDTLLQEALMVGSLDLGSATFDIEWRAKVAMSVLETTTPELARTIKEEIIQSAARMAAQRDQEHALLLDQAANGSDTSEPDEDDQADA